MIVPMDQNNLAGPQIAQAVAAIVHEVKTMVNVNKVVCIRLKMSIKKRSYLLLQLHELLQQTM